MSEIFIDSNANELFPQFSPDGSRIAFQTDRTGISQIWTADADGKNLRQIADTPFPSHSPQFSPDGSLIASNQNEGEYYANYIVSAEGGAPRRISPERVRDDLPAWSADGKYFFFTSNRSGEPNIWKMPADGAGEAVQITKDGANRALPALTVKPFSLQKQNLPAKCGAFRRKAARKKSCRNLPPTDFSAVGQ